MYEAMNRPVPDAKRYLERMGAAEPAGATLDGLNALICAHQTHVPFEDLDTAYYRKQVSLEIPALYEKIVEKRRGGFCFELNALFTRLLLDLGYDARAVFCRIVRGRDFIPPSAHQAIVVALGGALYFCDVGFGGPMPAGALRVEDGFEATVCGEAFRISRYDAYWWTVSRQTADGAWEDILQFNTFPQLPQEFLAVNLKYSIDPESLFVKRVLVNLRTPNGSLAVADDTFTAREGGAVTTVHIEDDAHLRRILAEAFGIRNLD